jgi:hypothetical protein
LKTITSLLCIISFALTQTYAQVFSRTFGDIGIDELELKEYILDTNAAALVLYDIGNSHFEEVDNTYDVVFERTTRIKIFKEAGIRWAEVEIPFYQEGSVKEKVSDIEAVAYNLEDGQVIKTHLDLSNAFEEKINSFWTIKKFAIPGVKSGTIIEYRYKIKSGYKFNLRDWEFQWRIPVLYSEYQVRMVPVYEYSFLFQGGGKFDVRESYEDRAHPRRFDSGVRGVVGQVYFDMVHTFGMRNVPAFVDEEYISSINDYILKIDFQLSKVNFLDGTSTEIIATWQELLDQLLMHDDFGFAVKKAEKLTSSQLPLSSMGNTAEMEKFNMVLDHVKRTYNWDGQDAKYISKPPARLVQEKYGNSADLNLLTVGLLNGVGIEAYPVLISTRAHGKIRYDYPYSHFFDYVIILARIEGQIVLSDATSPMSLNNRIPARCINDKGLIVQKKNVEWVGLECLFVSELNTSIDLSIKDELQLDAAIKIAATEYNALSFRSGLADQKSLISKEMAANHFTIDTASITVRNLDEKELPYMLKLTQSGRTEIVNEKIYISPFLDMVLSENPLKQNSRAYPIDINYPFKRTYTSSIPIPEGYHIDFKPENVNIQNPFFELNYKIETNDEIVRVSFDYTFRQDIYPASEHGKIKAYFNGIVKKGNEKIVFSR